MPAQAHSTNPHPRLRLLPRKPIHKQRLRAPTSPDCDDSTLPEPYLHPVPPFRLLFLLKDIVARFHYAPDTYLVCLRLLESVRSPIVEERLRLTLATVVLVAGKVHEFRVPKFLQLMQWGGQQFGVGELVVGEAEMLAACGYRVPVSLPPSLSEMEQEIDRLERQLVNGPCQ